MADDCNRRDRRQIRVIILADGMPAGGTERQIVLLLKGLRKFSPEIETFFGTLAKGGAREREAGRWADVVLPFKQSHQLDITLAWSLVTMVRRHHIDIVHSFGSISDIAGIIAAKLTGCRSINGSIRSARRRLTRRDVVSRFAMRFSDVIVANSQAGLRAFGVANRANAYVIYNGFDWNGLASVAPFKHQGQYLLMVGNFTDKKDHDALIRAFPEVLKHFPDHHLLLIGKGPRVETCRQLVDQLGLHERVLIITDCNDPATFIKGAAVCILLSPDGEGLSNVLMEYCALKRPVIATDLGGNPEIITNGESGLLIQSHQPEEVSRVIVSLLKDKEARDRLATHAHQVIAERFSLDNMIFRYVSLYRQTVENDPVWK